MSDVIVIGGGLSGLFVARELNLAGAQVTLLERGTVGCEASWAGGGILSPLYPWRYCAAVNALVRWSQDAYPALCADLAQSTGVDPQWMPCGMWLLDSHEFDAACDWAQCNGRLVERVTCADTARREPAIAAPDGAVRLPHVSQVRNPRLLQALLADVRRRGVRVIENEGAGTVVVDGDRVRGVNTASGFHGAGCVIVAAGAWSAQLLEALGPRVSIFPVKGQMLLYRLPPGMLRAVVLGGGHYVVPRNDGHVLVGSTLEETGFDKATTDMARRELAAAGATLVPALGALEPERHWAGLRPGSPNGVPYIGSVESVAGLYINAGHFRNGVVMGPAAARLAADLVLGRPTILDSAPYRLPAR